MIYDLNLNITSEELLPPHKREQGILDWVMSLHSPLQEVITFFAIIREGAGSYAGEYDAGTAYTFSQMVVFQRRVYYRTEVTTDYFAGINPTNTTYWSKVAESNIGLSTRIRFTNQKILLEYAMNLIFGTTFNQPPVLSDIYIVNQITDNANFVIGELDTDTSVISESDPEALWFISDVDADLTKPDFIVYIPISTWTNISPSPSERDNIFLAIINKYKLFGYTAEIQTY